MLLAQLFLFVHIIGAIALVGGSISASVLGHLARRAPGLVERRHIVLTVSPPLERMVGISVPITVVSGLVTLMLFGYSITDLWVLGTGLLIVANVLIQTQYWAKVGPRVHDALEGGDDAAAVALMRDPKSVAMGRIEVGLGFGIVALMVFRPNWPG
jgi:uncharacterized membrane protein